MDDSTVTAFITDNISPVEELPYILEIMIIKGLSSAEHEGGTGNPVGHRQGDHVTQ